MYHYLHELINSMTQGKNMQSKTSQTIAQLTAASILLLACSFTAQATYVIVDDELMPTPAPAQTTIHYTIPFAKDRSPLVRDGRNALDAIIPQMRGDQTIRIVGRPDANIYVQGKLAQLASNRANIMRNYLMHAGISGNNISIDVDNTPNPQANGSLYPSDIYITRQSDNRGQQTYFPASQTQPSTGMQPYTPPAPAPAVQSLYTPMPVTQPAYQQPYIPQPAPQTVAPATQPIAFTNADKIAREQIVRYISRAAQTGQMDPIAALKMIQILSGADNTTPQAINASAPQSNNQFGIAAAGSAPRPQEWMLTPDKTLKANIETWLAGNYNLQWNSADPYHIGHQTILTGDLLETVDKVVTAAGLSMSVSQKNRIIYINNK